MTNNVYVGYDTRLNDVYEVCKHSILRHSNVNVLPIVQQELRDKHIYTRTIDDKASTEFTLTRFLVPLLNNYTGWALFCDCDFLFLSDVNELFDSANNDYAVMVVKHDYIPKTLTKMDNKTQYVYPRKNWSSLILFNCEHILNKNIDVNNMEPSYLHQFKWLDDNHIGSIDIAWNHLVGYYTGTPKALHYTDGGPWFTNYKDTEYNALWNKEYEIYRQQL